MKQTFIVALFFLFLSPHAYAQIPEYFGDEPAENILDAPLYPGAEFIRITEGLDPYYETAMYVTLLPMKIVEAFFEKKIGGIGGKRVVYYSDGDVYPIIEDLIEIGVDILNPVQPACMSPEQIKKNFGNDLCLWGTIGTQDLMPFGTPQEVTNTVFPRKSLRLI